MEKRKSYDAVDLAKWLCAWLVMYIHLAPVFTGLPVLDKLIREGICRVAVPFFFAASAFLLFGKMGDPVSCARENRKALWGFCRRILTLYTVWALIYIAYKAVYRSYNGEPAAEGDLLYYIQGFFFRGVQIHLWYLIASVYAVWIVYLLWRGGKGALLAACVMGAVCPTLRPLYASVLQWPAVKSVLEQFHMIHCALLYGVPMMSMGVLCLTEHKKRTAKQWFWAMVGCFVPYIAQVCLTYRATNGVFEGGEMITMFPVVYCMVNWLFTADFRLPKKWMGKALRLSSTWIYCAHWLVMNLWHWVFAYDGVIRFGAVGVLTVISSVPYVLWKLLPKKQLAEVPVKDKKS